MEGTPRSSLGRAHGGPGIGSDGCTLPLGASVLHVWVVDLEMERESLAVYEEMLAAEEWRRVRRHSSRRLARRYIGRRGLLRSILGLYLDHRPKEVMFVYNAHGKPSLAPEHSSDLQFNLSDSGEKAAIAVGLGEPIGIDIERLRTVQLKEGLESCGSAKGKASHSGSPASTKHVFEFFQAWTCREAIAKAEGVGLQGLSGQSGIEGSEEEASSPFHAGGSLHRSGFHLHALTLPWGYVGALAARSKTCNIVYRSSQILQHSCTNPCAASQSSFAT